MITLCDISSFSGLVIRVVQQATWEYCPAKNNKNCYGFTLIEMVVVIVILGVMSTLAALIILQGVESYSTEDQRSNVHYQASLAMERMVREIRLIRTPASVTSLLTNRSQLQYTDINNASIGFRLNAGNGNIERSQDGGVTWQTLATGIIAPGGNIFTYLDNTGASTTINSNLWLIQIQFTATQGTQSVTMLSTLFPMNF
jgi:prepilin-type N-terminal cleavage/methylation domain-containing protein